MSAPPASPKRLRLGVSTCLLGKNVRYDGGHKRDDFLLETLGEYVDWVPVCPEVEIGLGTPRPPIRLERRAPEEENGGAGIALVMPDTGRDLTERMREYAERKIDALRAQRLAGYMLKSDSPSCGMEGVRVYDRNGVPSGDGVGLFADVLRRRFPQLPTAEEGRLNDARLRENFITRIFARGRWLDLVDAGLSTHALTRFHATHKYLLMSRDPPGARRLGRLLGSAGKTAAGVAEVAEAYEEGFGETLARMPSRGRHVNVLQHLAGYVSDDLDKGDRSELSDAIRGYRSGLVPLAVPLALLRHYVRKLEVEYLADQVYLEPHPPELRLLNYV